MAKLIFIGEKFDGRVYEIALDATTVGRGDENTLVIHDASVSHRHCEIFLNGPELIVRDLGSTNGTFVNGERLQNQQRPVRPGQIVKFGSIEARFETEERWSSGDDTDATAIHEHAQHVRQPPNPPKKPAEAALTLEGVQPALPDDHTLMLPRPPQSERSPTPPAPAKPAVRSMPLKRGRIILLAALILGLAVVLWLIFKSG